MNKTQLVQELTERLGDRKTASTALDEVLAVIVRTVESGESVTLTGFGVFERRERASRTGRNPRTGATLVVAATAVPVFRPGAEFRGVVSGARELAEPSALGPRRTTVRPTAARRRPAPTPTAAPVAPAAPCGHGGEEGGEAGQEGEGQVRQAGVRQGQEVGARRPRSSARSVINGAFVSPYCTKVPFVGIRWGRDAAPGGWPRPVRRAAG